VNDERDLPAGAFASWVTDMQGALRGEHGSDVPCDGCTACCTSSQFVTIEPDEADTLAHIPTELLFPAPRRPPGHMLLGYDERGHCPMLVANRCSIYEHRPRACRTYDCRIFAATGVEIDDETKSEITHRVRRWRFEFASPDDRSAYDALRASVSSLRATYEGAGPPDPTRLAVRAIEALG
jgi:Fe-S-cluster containining protein